MRRFRVNIKDGETSGIAFGDPVRPIDVMWLHATGFNAITYESILEPLGGQMHAAALDLRGHGRSKLPANPRKMKSWNKFRDDVIQVLEKTAPDGAVLGGHSMGATVALLVAGKRPDLVRGLVLTDPVLLKKRMTRIYNIPLVNMFIQKNALSKGALKRRRQFGSPSEAAESLRGRGAFKTWRAPFLDDYVVDGVLRQDNGQYELSCTPEWESAIYNAHRYRPWGALRRLRKKRIPIIVLQADRDSTSPSDLDQRIHNIRPDAAITKVPGTTHFIPMERPYVVRDALKMLYEAMIEGHTLVDYVGAVRRTIDDSVGIMD
ncbi:MAG TPA: alpha/beta hydrolase [Hyphomonadaceae bacterium]|jgi:pimeloyl-ACP methyl ester carboxylesterase|nr:alpha/beta hydrolase [Hyphomonadaceae bacterium]